jgi:hypothetical protein
LADAGGKPMEVPRHPLSVRILVAALSTLLAAGVVWLLGGEAVSHVHAWVILGRLEPPHVTIVADPSIVKLGQQAEIKVLLDRQARSSR